MSVALPYMGTKRDIAPSVAKVIDKAKPGIVLDAFAGMCAIGQALGVHRNLWNNDAQRFASEVASALFTCGRPPRLSLDDATFIKQKFDANFRAVEKQFERRLREEEAVLNNGALGRLNAYQWSSRHVGNTRSLEKEREALHTHRNLFPYKLCAITFADGYFGMKQALDIDSARYAIDVAAREGVITGDTHRWLLVSLCQAANRIATTTGHFAQFLKANSNNVRHYIAQRKRSFWNAWMACARDLKPLGTRAWRRRNRAFNAESLALLGMLAGSRVRPSVVYADPPYTDDQYSRYYHVWETLVKYDYPPAQGEGRYRPDRFQTPFSRVDDVGWAFLELIRRSATLGADLVLSYPTHGLLHRAGYDAHSLLKQFYSTVSLAAEIPHRHSTMGGSKGRATHSVIEQVYFASNP